MTLSALGIFSAAGAGGIPASPPAYELIESTILTGTQASVTFSGLGTYSATYKHLQIRATIRSSNNAYGGVLFRLNGDATSNYDFHGLESNASSVASYNSTNRTFMLAGRSSGTNFASNIFGAYVVDVLDAFSTTKNKTVRTLSGVTGASNFLAFESGLLRNTSSTTSLTILNDVGNLVAGSRFSLYGIKG